MHLISCRCILMLARAAPTQPENLRSRLHKSVTTCADWHSHRQILQVEQKSEANMSRSRAFHAKEHDPRVLVEAGEFSQV